MLGHVLDGLHDSLKADHMIELLVGLILVVLLEVRTAILQVLRIRESIQFLK